jgi:transcription antitermination factor NusG
MHSADNETARDDYGFTTAWYALYTRHQHEKAVARILFHNRFETFLPLYVTAHQWKDRTRQLFLPLFPCYVFIRGGLDRWHEIIATPGAHHLLGIAGKPSAIPEDEIAAVRRAMERGLRVEPHPFLNCGDWVRVKSGPLAGMEGILVRKKNSLRLVLSVELLEKSVAVELDACLVERAARPNPVLLPNGAPANFPVHL